MPPKQVTALEFAAPSKAMKALFADLSEQDRQRKKDFHAHKATERRQVLALCDAIQDAVAEGRHDRAHTLLQEMHAIVDSALARRRLNPAAGRRMNEARTERDHD
jgi:hypothetical protein